MFKNKHAEQANGCHSFLTQVNIVRRFVYENDAIGAQNCSQTFIYNLYIWHKLNLNYSNIYLFFAYPRWQWEFEREWDFWEGFWGSEILFNFQKQLRETFSQIWWVK